MKIIALHDADNTKFPNLALMKLSAYHKSKGDIIEWYQSLQNSLYDLTYSSKVFTWTNDLQLRGNVLIGGTGYRTQNILSEEIEHCCPDYDLYGQEYSMGFLTRGCIRKCEWCVVPEKEGQIRPHADIEEFVRHRNVVLLDNNVLASSHGVKQIEKIIKLKLRIDFNQGLDARLIDDSMAKLLSKVKWLSPIRLSCDTQDQIPIIQKAVTLLRWHNATPRVYFVYVLVKEIPEALERIKFLKGMNLDPFAQPYRDQKGNEPDKEQKKLARWVNMKSIFRSVAWDDYKNGEKLDNGNNQQNPLF